MVDNARQSVNTGVTPAANHATGRCMIELSRELVAYAIIGVLVIAAVPTGIVVMRRRRREKLRRRGIKTYGH